MTTILDTLNQGQKEAADGFFAFLFSPDRELIISGPGGVGKSHLVAALIDEIMPRYFQTCKLMGIEPEYDNVEITSTTNKAAEILSVFTKRPTSTVHSFLNLRVQDDYTTGQSKLTPTGKWHVHERKIVFIDECSLVDIPLKKYVNDGLHKSKVVYVGDHCQLAPIMEPISPIYREPMPFFELTEPMRTRNPDLMAVQAQLRETVKTGEFKPIRIVPGVIDLLDDDAMQAEISRVFATQTLESRILAYTNKRVMQFNDFIRQVRQLPEEYTVGEMLINNQAIKMGRRMISVEEELEVLKVDPQIRSIEIEPGTNLQVQVMRLRSSIGDEFDNILVPVDREHHTALIKYYARMKNWDRMYHLKNTYPDLRQRDAATVHKAQGSTYDSVFIDLGDLSDCRQPNQAARLLYVAFTRPRTRVFLYGNLAAKYGGLIH